MTTNIEAEITQEQIQRAMERQRLHGGRLDANLAALGFVSEGQHDFLQHRRPFFTVQGKIIKVNGADVQVFEYASAEAMEADAAQVSADGGSVGTSMMMWMATPHFFKSGHLLVLYLGDDTVILAALQSVYGQAVRREIISPLRKCP